jgi:hypothetical protein
LHRHRASLVTQPFDHWVALLLVLPLVDRLLLGKVFVDVAATVARVAAVAAIAIGITYWPGSPQCSMLIHSDMAMSLFERQVSGRLKVSVGSQPALRLHHAE